MQVLCKASNTASDIRCNICGQGFLVFWTRTAPQERAACEAEILTSLRNHHAVDSSSHAHPRRGFHLPEWQGEARHSAAALLGGAPDWAFVSAAVPIARANEA